MTGTAEFSFNTQDPPEGKHPHVTDTGKPGWRDSSLDRLACADCGEPPAADAHRWGPDGNAHLAVPLEPITAPDEQAGESPIGCGCGSSCECCCVCGEDDDFDESGETGETE